MNDLLHLRLIGALPSAAPLRTAWREDGFLALQWLSPAVAEAARAEFPPPEDGGWHTFDKPLEAGKQEGDAKIAGEVVETIHAAFSSPVFVEWLREITGINSLVADPERTGGGIHQSGPGARLGLHVDFSTMDHLPGLARAVNVIVFLDDASFDYEQGGWFEIERGGVVLPEEFVAGTRLRPRPGLLVIFPSNDYTYHGHPVPIAEGGPLRRSIPAYFFRRIGEGEVVESHSTRFLEDNE